MKTLKYGAVIVFIICGAFISAFFSGFFWNGNSSNVDRVFCPQSHKVWAHRGLVDTNAGINENSIEAFKNAEAMGAKGVEIDVYFDAASKRFIVSHDLPDLAVHTPMLTLKGVLEALNQETYIWLDFKNLSTMKDVETRVAIEELSRLLTQHDKQKNVIVEANSASHLSTLREKNIHALYSLNIEADLSAFQFFYKLAKFRYEILTYQLLAVSLPYDQYTDRVSMFLPEVSYFLFTVNDRNSLEKYGADAAVKVMLSDKAFYDM